MTSNISLAPPLEVVETGAEPPPLQENPSFISPNEQISKRGKALDILHSTMNDDIFMRISHLMMAKEVWEKIEKEEFEALKMNEVETIKDFMTNVMKVVNQIRLMGEKLQDSKIVEKVTLSYS
ncbi:hypothetical protein CR513_23224, partial [Mucuna pruriens]